MLLLALLQWSAAPACGDTLWLQEVRYRLDSAAEWHTEKFHLLPHAEDIVHVAVEAELPAELERPLALRLQAMATCEVLWDGENLGAAGQVGATAEQEVAGPLRQVLHIPDRLASPGSHRVELKCSMFHRGFVPTAGFWTLEVGSYGELAERGDGLILALFSVSGMVLVGFFALAMWAYDWRRNHDRDQVHGGRAADLWLSIFCFGAASLAVAEAWRLLVDYGYPWHIWRLRAITGLAWLVAVVLVVYVVRRFPGPGGRRWMLGTAVGTAACVLLFTSWDAKATSVFLVALPVAGWWCLRAMKEGRRGALAAGGGVFFCSAVLIWQPLLFIDRNLYLAVDMLLLCLLIGHARENDALRREREEARLAASRLEAELLRRQLQPHFLMNTLTALAEWIEEDPPTAVRMIEALGSEMRTLHAISARSTVRLAEEIELCRSHLEIMALRREKSYRLDVDGVDLEASVPPAVLHTLVENSVTHGDPSRHETRLFLSQENAPDRRVLIFEAPLGGGVAPKHGQGGGTGLRYVAARLKEAYGEGARFEAGAAGEVWRCRLELPLESSIGGAE